jgi:hypothetical protein
MPNGTMTGMVIPTLAGLADHTYVITDNGRSWPCWGRSSGGTPLCSGSGNLLQADCLARPDSAAGIIYGKTGVCHQMANRIRGDVITLISTLGPS